MLRRAKLAASLAVLAALAAGGELSPATPQDQGYVRPISARGRVFREIGPGVEALKRDAAGLHYVLATPASSVAIYGAADKRIGEIPNANSRGAKIVFAQDFDLDATGRLYVADRGANAVKIFRGNGTLEATVPVAAPTSVVALPGDEFAVASLRADSLVSVYGFAGKLLRRFGDLAGSPEPVSSSATLNRGRLYGDPTGHLYFAFTAVPDPTIRNTTASALPPTKYRFLRPRSRRRRKRGAGIRSRSKKEARYRRKSP
jgi:hypothetical protein